MSSARKVFGMGKDTSGKEPDMLESPILSIRRLADIAIVSFTTSRLVDASNVEQLGRDFDGLIDRHGFNKLVLNFENINYINSEVMGKLVRLRKKIARKAGGLRLCNIAHNVFEIFVIMRFDDLFQVCDSEEAAISELRP